MQSLTYHQNTSFDTSPLINRYQSFVDVSPEYVRDAVRAWSASMNNQDVVASLIVEEWERQGGGKLEFPRDISLRRQKLFRWLDNRFDSEKYRENVCQLTPAIMAVLPIEYRTYLFGADCKFSRLAKAEKEVAEAKQAIILDAPEHQKLKEVSEGIASLFSLMPEQIGPLMAMVTSMLGVM